MSSIFASFAISTVIVMEVIYVAACSAYLIDYCVRLLSGDKYEIITKIRK